MLNIISYQELSGVKTTNRYPTWYPLEWLKLKSLPTSYVGKDVEHPELYYNAGGSMKIMQLIWQIYGIFFIKLSTHQPRDPAAPLFGIYAREMKMCPHKVVYRNDQSHNITTWCPSTREWVTDFGIFLRYSTYYSVIKRNELWLHEAMWMNLTKAGNKRNQSITWSFTLGKVNLH